MSGSTPEGRSRSVSSPQAGAGRIKPMDFFEAQLLAMALLGLEETDENFYAAEQLLEEKYDCEFEAFMKIASDLLPLATVAHGALSGTRYRGFAQDRTFIVKREAARNTSEAPND